MMIDRIEELRKLIQDFIASKNTEIKLNYNVILSEASIASNVKQINEDIFYIGDWRISEKIGFWEAVYNEIITDNEEVEVVLEIKKVENEDKYTVSDWHIKEFF